MADFYLKSGSATERANSTAYALGDRVVIARADTSANYLVVRKWVLECTTAGTSGAAVPAWPATVTQDTTTVTDDTVTWTFRKPGFSSGTTANWAFSSIYMFYVATAMAAGDRLFVSNNHAESVAAEITIAFPGTLANPCQVICVSDLAAPPTASATTAAVETTGTSNITINGSIYCYGVAYNVAVGAGAVNATLILGAYNTVNNILQRYDTCNFKVSATGTGAKIFPGGGGGSNNNTNRIIFNNCGVTFSSATTGFRPVCDFEWNGGSVLVGTALTGSLFQSSVSAGRYSKVTLSGVDLSNAGAGCNLFLAGTSPTYGSVRNCKLPAAWTGSLVSGTMTVGEGYTMHNSDNADTNYRIWEEFYAGSRKSETTLVRTGGASDGTTPLSWRLATSARAVYPANLLDSPEIYSEWIETVGVAKTITVEILHDSTTNLKDDEIWLDVQYLGTTGFPLGVFANDAKANVLAAAADQTVSTATWTTTDLTNPNKQKLSVTFTPQEKGVAICRVMVAKPSYTVYVDPLATLS